MLQLFGYLELSCETIILSQLITEIPKVTIYYVYCTLIPLIFCCEIGKIIDE